MRYFNLNIAYFSLLLISIISSLMLFIIVASESNLSLNPIELDANSIELQVNNINNELKLKKEIDEQIFQNLNDKPLLSDNYDNKKNYEEKKLIDNRIDNRKNVNEITQKGNENVKNSNIDNSNNQNFDNQFINENVPKIDEELLSINTNIDDNVNALGDKYNENSKIEKKTTTETNNANMNDLPTKGAVITFDERAEPVLFEPTDDSENEQQIIQDLGSTEINTDSSSNSLPLLNDEISMPDIGSQSKQTNQTHISDDEMKQKINDSGGIMDQNNIMPDYTTESNEVNLTAEENPIPVFSEWAQKQMEEAEKQQHEKDVNLSTKNSTNGNKPQKLRAKNYASPDCGAKIIASNIEAQNTGAVLSSSKDEYMLSPCINRIWFVVELCEAIQAKQIDLANFELFSSSPKNFTVAVSNRYPTRDWSNVGRFIADDQRNIQSFELHPHLFGKYVRVDVHSHYNSEHFCPISLFRVYGTSEFEAFETENRNPYDDLDDVDDEQEVVQKDPANFIKSASDAVYLIVKKAAAQVLGKKDNNELRTENLGKLDDICFTPTKIFECKDCQNSLTKNVNYLLSCKYFNLLELISKSPIKNTIIESQFCGNFNIELEDKVEDSCNQNVPEQSKTENKTVTVKNTTLALSYYFYIIPLAHLVAMCHLLGQSKSVNPNYLNNSDSTTLNLTIDKKLVENIKDIIENAPHKDPIFNDSLSNELLESHNQNLNNAEDQIPQPPLLSAEDDSIVHDSTEKILVDSENVNIFNIQNIDEAKINKENEKINEEKNKGDEIATDPSKITKEDNDIPIEPSIPLTTASTTIFKDTSTENDANWETIDNLISEQVTGEPSNTNTGSYGQNTAGILTNNNNQNVQYKSATGHSESVFIRLSNRIKALERNMSLSGQYLEELSRRYKKQVEELQYSFAKTLNALEEQSRRSTELEKFLVEQNNDLHSNIEDLTVKLYVWMTILGFVTSMVLIFCLTSSCKRFNEKPFDKTNKSILKKQQNPLRRKSAEVITASNSGTSNSIKTRRPSEEAMKINGSYKDLMIEDIEKVNGDNIFDSDSTSSNLNRNRKMSVLYQKENQPILHNRQINRQDSGDFFQISDYGGPIPEEISVVEDEYENYLPGSDLMYNEFMPEGRSGNQSTNSNSSKEKHGKLSKIRRLSSPAFLKFNKNISKHKSSTPQTTSTTGWEWYRLKKTVNNDKLAGIETRHVKVNGVVNNSVSNDNINDINVIGYSPNSTISAQILLSSNSGHKLIGNSVAEGGSESDSLRTTNSETESSIMILADKNTKSNVSNGNNNASNKRGSKKQRSFKKIFKKVF